MFHLLCGIESRIWRTAIAVTASSLGACSLIFPTDGFNQGGPSADASTDTLQNGPSDGSTDVAVDTLSDSPISKCPKSSAIFEIGNPSTGDTIYTISSTEVANARSGGYTENRGTPFRAYTSTAEGRAGVYRLRNPATDNRYWTIDQNEMQTARNLLGYTAEGTVGFYAAVAAGPCVSAVHRLVNGNRRVLSVSDAAIKGLVNGGWTDEGIKFYLPPP